MTTTLRAFLPLVLLASACSSLHIDDPFQKNGDNPEPDFPPGEIFPSGPQPFYGTTTVAATPPPPISGGTLLVLSRTPDIAVAADPDRDVIHIVDLQKQIKVAGIALQAGDEPGRVIEDAAGRVHVALRHGGAIVTIDPSTHSILSRRAVCSAPRGLVYDADLDQIHVACAGGELISLPAADGPAVRTLQLDDDLRDVVILNGKLYVSRFHTAQVLAVDADGLVTRRFSPATTVDSAGNVFTPDAAFRLVADPTTNTLYMAHQRVSNGTVVTTDPGGYGGSGGCSTGIVQGSVSAMNPDVATPQSPSVPGLVLPVDVAITSYGQLSVVSAGSGHTPGAARVQAFDTQSLATSSDNCGFFAQGTFDDSIGQATAVATWGSSFVIQSREPAQLYLNDGSYVAIPLSSDSREDTGHAVFHSDSSAGLACASCHLEGGEDGHVWTFDNSGPRRTQSLRGGVLGTEPFHWDGDQHDFNDIVSNVFEHRMAGPALATDQSFAMRTWVNTIPLMPKRVQDEVAVARGKALFNDAANVGCVSCHSGSLMTDNATVDVGTGAAFQVPSLRGVAWRAPFLHDGRATTLVDRFGPNGGGDQHGVTSQLSSDQVNDLVAYLQTL